jgi:alpha-glucan,water dikinase
MSNSVVHNLLNRGLIRPLNFEHQNKLNSSVYQTSTANPALGKIGRSKLYGKGLKQAGRSLVTETGGRPLSFVPRAVLAMDPQAAEKFSLDGNIDLLVEVTSTTVREVNIQIAYTSDTLFLHWGAILDNKENWVLPSRSPDRTQNFKNSALRTPFVKVSFEFILRRTLQRYL